MLSEKSVVDHITVLKDGQLQLRQSNIVFRDGEEIARIYHREVLDPAQVVDLSKYDIRVQHIAEVVWTTEVIAARQAQIALNDAVSGKRPV